METEKTEVFTSLRPLLQSLAYQLLGNGADAEDMVQECFLRWERTDAAVVRSPRAFLTTVMTRLCLKHLQSARVRRERYVGSALPESLLQGQVFDPTDHAQLAESLSFALLVMLQTLSTTERAVFLLREVFDCEYSEIALIIDKTEDNCRQILRRARERLAVRQSRFEVTPLQQEQTLQKFLQASASGNWQELMALLADDAILVCDGNDLNQTAPAPARGRQAVIESVSRKGSCWWPENALVHTIHYQGHPVVLAYRDGKPVSAAFAPFSADGIKALSVVTCPVRLRTLLVQQAPAEAGVGDNSSSRSSHLALSESPGPA